MLKLTRWTLAHRRLVVLAWIVGLVGVIAASSWTGSRYTTNFSLPNSDSQRAVDLLETRFPAQAGDSDQIVISSRTGLVTDASVRAAVEPMLDRIAELPHVTAVVSPYETGGSGRAISPDATIAFATVTFDQQAQELPLAAIERVVDTAQDIGSADLAVELGGPATQRTQEPSVSSATAIGLAAAVIVLLLSFGSFVAMGLSVVTALFGLGIGISLIALGTQVIDIVDFSTDLALMLGLGVGIDYALFIVTRRFRRHDRRDRAHGHVRARHQLPLRRRARHLRGGAARPRGLDHAASRPPLAHGTSSREAAFEAMAP
jgi:RND superfamily putative drug exporter